MQLKSVMLSEQSIVSEDPYEVVHSNVEFVEELGELEVCKEALLSYYVSCFTEQLENSGFSFFVYNSRWNKTVVDKVVEGLKKMKAHKNLKLFQKSALLLEQLSPEALQEYLHSGYFGDNPIRELLDTYSDDFYELQNKEDLIQLNCKWLMSLSNLKIVSEEDLEKDSDPSLDVELESVEAYQSVY